MSEYIRNRIPGGTYFFTVNLYDRRQSLLVDHIRQLRAAVRYTRAKRPFHIDAWVVLPEHMHCIWTLPVGDTDYSSRWKEIKSGFSKRLPGLMLTARGERHIWQRRYWEHTIRNERDYASHMDYVHINPVKHGLVKATSQWPFSTFKKCVGAGVYPINWACKGIELAAGEPQD
ncbi:MAG TPA: transposase [Burkholderiaceae bacterium]